MSVNLIPNEETPMRGEQKNIALLDLVSSRMLDLFQAIENGTDSKSAMAYVRRCIDQNKDVPAEEMLVILDNLYKEVAAAYATVVAFRQGNK